MISFEDFKYPILTCLGEIFVIQDQIVRLTPLFDTYLLHNIGRVSDRRRHDSLSM